MQVKGASMLHFLVDVVSDLVLNIFTSPSHSSDTQPDEE